MLFKMPVVKISGVSVPRAILGHLPFVGESYQGSAKNHECVERFSKVENTVSILSRAVQNYGITVLSAVPATEGELARLYLEAVHETVLETGIDIALIPCFRIMLTVEGKPLNDYRRWLTYYGIEKRIVGQVILEKYLNDPILQCREGWKERFLTALKHYAPYKTEIEKISIKRDEMRRAIESLKDSVAFAELGSETDFLVMIDRMDLLGELIDWLQGSFGYRVILASHHAGLTIPTLEKAGIKFHGYVTPINKRGVMMFPTQELAVEGIRNARKPIIAIKTLAGGRLQPQPALEYVYGDLNADTCMIGVSSKEELDQDFTTALRMMRTHENL